MSNKKNKTVKTIPVPSKSLMLVQDMISFCFSLMPIVSALIVTTWLIMQGIHYSTLVLLVAPLILLSSFILIVFIIRLCLPKLKPGRYRREFSKVMVSWFCHLALSRSAKISGLDRIIQSFNVFKYFYWRALGVDVSFQVLCSFDIDFVDCPLIKIGKGVTLGSQTTISCHTDVGRLFYLARVIIEDNVFVGMSNVIGPNSHIKKGAWIGFGNTIVNQTIEEYAILPSIAVLPTTKTQQSPN